MSADNGVYILKLKDQCRVIYAHAIENLDWSYASHVEHHPSYNGFIPTRLVEYYGGTRYTRDVEKAQKVAYAMSKQYPVLEYGIKTFVVNRTWGQVVRDAKRFASIEIEAIKKDGSDWKMKEIPILERILVS